jgi:hypothetical protein
MTALDPPRPAVVELLDLAADAPRPLSNSRAGRPGGEVRTRPGDDGLYVATADEWLQVLRVRVAGRPVAPSDVLAPGITLTAPTPPALKPPGGPGNNTARG